MQSGAEREHRTDINDSEPKQYGDENVCPRYWENDERWQPVGDPDGIWMQGRTSG